MGSDSLTKGSNPSPLRSDTEFWSLNHQGNPRLVVFTLIFLEPRVFRRFPGASPAGMWEGDTENQDPVPASMELLLSAFVLGFHVYFHLEKGSGALRTHTRRRLSPSLLAPSHINVWILTPGTVSSAGEQRTTPSESRWGRGRGSWPVRHSSVQEKPSVPTLSLRGCGAQWKSSCGPGVRRPDSWQLYALLCVILGRLWKPSWLWFSRVTGFFWE